MANSYPMRMPALLCFNTCPDTVSAERIADALVAERLAACVQVLPGLRSVYRWQGALERSEEVLLLIKTTRERFAALRDRILALSPYETPEVIALDIVNGSEAYLRWIDAETAPRHAGEG